MEEVRLLINMLKRASQGHHVMVVGKGLSQTDLYAGRGAFHARDHSRNIVITVPYDTLWFVDEPPEDVKAACLDKVGYGFIEAHVVYSSEN